MTTLDDVAKFSGVSAMTVSRVINNKGAVSEKTRHRVLDAIQQLNYRPNLVARGLATNRTNSIGVLVSYLENPIYAVVVSGINKTDEKYGMNIILGSGQDEESLLQSTNTLLNKQIDGLIVLPADIRRQDGKWSQLEAEAMLSFYRRFDRIAAEASGNGIPIVLMGDYAIDHIAARVCEDYREGARMAVRYLHGQGHRRIGMVSHCIRDAGIWQERYQGFLEEMNALGCRVEEAWCESCLEKVDDAFQAGMRLFARRELPTALYCANDVIAVGIENAARECGLRVPDDLSVIGHDGSLYSEISYPRLTTVSIRPFAIGCACMEQIAAALREEPENTAVQIIKPEILPGQSVCRAAVPAVR